MQQYIVTGMSCAACQARVEKAVSKVPGVESVSVSLLTNSMGVEGTAFPGEIIGAVTRAGYGASPKEEESAGGKALFSAEEEALKDRETPLLKRRLIISAVFLAALMYITMGSHMLGLPLPQYFTGNHLALALTQMLLAAAVMIVNGRFFTGGFGALARRSPNMDTLVALGSSVSFGWSLFVFYRMCGLVTAGVPDAELMDIYHNQLYFESAAMIPALITVGKLLEAKSKGKTTNALKSLVKLAPKTAVLLRDGGEERVPAEQVRPGDVFAVRPGESIPVDAVVTAGGSAVNESALTGESVPVDKAPGDEVSAGTINVSGYLECRALRVGQDTALAQIVRMVSDAAATKAPVARIADRVAAVFVPAVICVSLITAAGWLIAGQGLGFALERAISVLVISCPCALGLATPVAIMAGSGKGAGSGILFKTGEALENAGKAQIAVLDKTGTITSGEPVVTDIIPSGTSRDTLLKTAYSLEVKSEHPLAKAVAAKAEEESVEAFEISSFTSLPGNGLSGQAGGVTIHGGSEKFIRTLAVIPPEFAEISNNLSEQGKTPLFFETDGKFIGIIAVADKIKDDSAQAVRELKNQGLCVVMLTGDNVRTANAVARAAGVDRVVAGVLPGGKEEVIRSLKKKGRVVMVGDGINDAPALTAADTGIAIGTGTDVAADSACVVLMNSSLRDVPAAVRLSRATMKIIRENLFWAFFYNIICIPLAAGLFGINMSPMIGAAAMSLSSFTVCMNALRLNLVKVRSAAHDRPLKGKKRVTDIPLTPSINEKEENKAMTKTVKIEGMMCPHCEAAVKKAMEELPFVQSAQVSHEQGTAVLTLSADYDGAAVKAAVEEKGYTFISAE